MLTNNLGYVLSNEEDNDGRGNHEETVVEQQTILAQVFRVQLLLDNYSITGSEQIIQQDKCIAKQKNIMREELKEYLCPVNFIQSESYFDKRLYISILS